MHIVFTGIQGCGKGTQARLLIDSYKFEIVEMGGQLRKEIASGSDLGKKIKKVIDSGYLVDDELGGQIMKKAIEEYKTHDRVIFDGFIRLQWNKEIFDSYLSDYKVVLFNLPESEAKKRLLGRMYNKTTGETFMSGTTHDPETGEVLIKRDDDNEASIKKRIQEYIENTVPLTEEMKEEGRVIEVNAYQTIEEVFSELENKLELQK